MIIVVVVIMTNGTVAPSSERPLPSRPPNEKRAPALGPGEGTLRSGGQLLAAHLGLRTSRERTVPPGALPLHRFLQQFEQGLA